ncbi:E3 ubiquitin-protein ligase RKP [Diplonema papillatum]|nr:E3 ubiquitin-protein ligase RKP [Diplonema papillatum]
MPAWDDEWCAALREPSVGKALQASQKLLQGIVAEAEHDVAALRGSDGGADPVVLDKKVREAPVACPSKVGYFPVAAQQSGDLSTLRASTGFTSGRYMYEAIVLAKKKSAQIGWATQAKCTHGAGGNLNGYAFDGRTAKKWNTKPEDYGVECEVGDVITTGIDLWNGSVHFMVNGQYLGPAFTGIPTEQSVQASVREPLVFSPAISTSKGDALAVNFGSLPFRYPMPRFAPVQPGTAILRAQGEKLLAGLRMCARHSVNATTVPVKPTDNSAATAVSPADQSTASVVRSVSQDPDNAVEGSTKAFSETATSSPVSSASAALNLRTPANDAPATQPRAHNAARYAGVPRHVCRAVAMAILKTLLTAFLEKFRSIFGQTCQGCPQELLVFVTAVWIPFLMESTGNRRILQQILAMTFRLTPSTASRALWQHTLRVLCFQSSIAEHVTYTRSPILLPCDTLPPFTDTSRDNIPKGLQTPTYAYLQCGPEGLDRCGIPSTELNKGESPLEKSGEVLATTPTTAATTTAAAASTEKGGNPPGSSSSPWPSSPGRRRRTKPTRAPATEYHTPAPVTCKVDPALKLLQEVLEIDGKRLSDAWGYSSTFHDDLIMVCQSKPPGQTASRIFFPFVGWAGRRRKPLEFQGEHLDCEACQKSIETVTSALHAPVQRQTSAIISSVFHSLLSDAPQPTPTSTFHQAFNRTPPSGQIRVHRLLSRLSHYNKDPPHDSSGSDPCRASTNVIVNDVQVIGMTRLFFYVLPLLIPETASRDIESFCPMERLLENGGAFRNRLGVDVRRHTHSHTHAHAHTHTHGHRHSHGHSHAPPCATQRFSEYPVPAHSLPAPSSVRPPKLPPSRPPQHIHAHAHSHPPPPHDCRGPHSHSHSNSPQPRCLHAHSHRPPSPPIRNQLNLADDPSVNNTTPLLGGPHRPDHEPANAPETEANSSSGMHCATGKGGKSGSRGCCSSSRGGGGCGSRLGAPAGAGGAGSDANSGTDDNTDNSTNTNSNNISSSSSSSSNNNDNPTPGMRQSSGNTRPGDSHHHDTNPPIRQPASVNTNNSSPSDPCLTGRATEFRTPDLPPARSSNPLLEPETETRPRGTDRRNEQQRTGGGKKGAGPPRHHEPAKSASSPADMFDSLMQLCTHATQQHVARVTANLFEKTKMTLLLESTAEKLCPLVINEVASVSRTCCWAYSVTASFDLQLPVYNGASPVALFFNLIVRIFLHHENTPASHRLPLCLFEMLFAIMNFRRRCPSEFKAFLQEYPALLPYLLRNTYGEEVGPELSGRFLSGIACVLDVPTALRDVVMRESDGKGPRSADPGRSPIVRDLASVLFSCFSNKAVWVITLSVLSRLGKKLVFGGRADGDAMLLVQWNVFSELETEADAVEASLYIATEWAAQIALQASSLPKPPNSSSVGQQKHEDQPPSPYDFVKHALTRLCWSMNELTMLAGETSPDSNQGNAIRRQKKSNMMHDLTKKLLWVLEFSTATMVTLFWPDPSAEAADAVQERKTTNLRMLFEALWHALQRFASDSSPDATNRKHQLKLLAPLVGCVVNLLFAQQQPSVLRPFPEEGDICVDESNPFLAELSVTKVEWSLDPFIYIHELDWTKAWEDAFGIDEPKFPKLAYLKSPLFLDALARAHAKWRVNELKVAAEAGDLTEDDMCCICYTSVADTEFPCGHSSCKGCITRHLLNSSDCFFCKNEVSSLQPKAARNR